MKIFIICALFFVFTTQLFSVWEKCSELKLAGDINWAIYPMCFIEEYNKVLYVGSQFGLHYSKDNGDSWDILNFLPLWVYDMIFVDNKFFVVTEQGILSSSDNGHSWVGRMNGIKNWKRHSIINIYGGKNFIFTAKINYLFQPNFQNVLYISTNHGESWSEIGSEFKYLNIYDFFADELNIYIITDYGIMVSRDEGKTWDVFNVPNSGHRPYRMIRTFKKSIYVLDGYETLYSSSDEGETWKTHEFYHAYHITNISINDSLALLTIRDIGIYYSTNNGNNWTGPMIIDNERFTHPQCIGSEYIFMAVDAKVTYEPEYIIEPAVLYRRKISELVTLASIPNEEPERTLSIHPNPATDYIYINFNDLERDDSPSNNSGSGSVKIYNTLGQCVSHLTPTLSKGEGVRIDVLQLPTGVYFVRYGNRVEKFVKW